ncbi:SDR family oxidoreductase [Candidatus Saccharibacteria bacterium]|nr:SDR family oxidoreductase [Candidatus Saccharibacteria bacterium]
MIVITGASDGLGFALAKLYAERGEKVANISRRECEYAEKNYLCDLADSEQIGNAAKELQNNQEPIAALINCAGVLSVQDLDSIDATELQHVFAVNVEAPILLTSKLIEKLKANGSDIVNIASTVGTKAYASQAAYGASKWALRGFSQNLQLELKSLPNRVISFCPGGFRTKLFEKATGIDNTIQGDWMSPTDLAAFIITILDLPKNIEVSEVIVNRK